MQKIIIVGTSGSGKTTLAKNLSQKISISYYDLDDYFWLPNWQSCSPEAFKQKILTLTDQDNWIISGNHSYLKESIWPKADIIIWLDYNLVTCLWRCFKRSIFRILNHTSCCNNNFESFRRTFMSKNSILLWVLKTYFKRKKDYGSYFKANSNHFTKFFRFKNSKETQCWLNTLDKFD